VTAAEIRQAPGWWPSLVRIVCDECGYRGPVIDLNKEISNVRVRILRDSHDCDNPDGASS
jgi:hypothetical protein